MKLKTAKYLEQVPNWPKTGNHILAQFDDNSIVVYQAYNEQIAKAVVNSQNFHSAECQKAGFKLSRMTWIKTNFLWMAYRSGWATKPNQERILAITISREGFDSILKSAVSSKKVCESKQFDLIRLQWDPDHQLDYSKVPTGRKAVQLGIRGDFLHKFSKEYIKRVEDITEFVVHNRERIKKPSELFVPEEKVYRPKDPQIAQQIELSA
jgi:Domain of unknown function (DUF4291)